ncbi:MAG: WG repeat-containing protein [Bacteroidota bacterium]
MRLSCLIFFLLITSTLSAQRVTYLYPVKVDHKWGYIDKRGRMVIEPKYDAIGDQYLKWHGRMSESPFRLMQENGKLGLLGDQCREVLAANYDYISPLSSHLFIVANDTLMRIVDRKGQPAVEGNFTSVRLLDTLRGEYFKMNENGLWGVYQVGVGELLPAHYSDIEILRGGGVYFKVRKAETGEAWGLVNSRHKQILANDYFDIRCISENFFATLEVDERWSIRDSTGKKFMEKTWKNCKPLNSRFISLSNDWRRKSLFSLEKKDTLPVTVDYSDLSPFNEDFVLFRNGWARGLLDTTGRAIIPSVFRNIQPNGDSLFQVQDRTGNWGLYSLARGQVLPCGYDEIGRFEGAFAIVERTGLKGLIDTGMVELIPAAFDRIVVTDSLIKAYESGTLSLFKVVDGQVALMDEFNNVQTLRVGYGSKYYVEAMIKKNRNQQSGILDGEASPFSFQVDGRWEWRKDPDTKLWALFDRELGPNGGLPPSFLEVLYLKEPALSFVFTNEKTTPNNGEIMPALYPVQRFLHAALFSHKTGKFITPFDLLALRGRDFESGLPMAVYLHKNGKFGLLGRDGKRATKPNGDPLLYTWIGAFIDGKARFCMGGKLVLADAGKQPKTGVGQVEDFVVQFGLHTTASVGTIKERKMIVEANRAESLRWGYIDTLGRVVIEPAYDFANDFVDSFAVNQKQGKWGVIDQNEKVVLPFEYNNIVSFHGNWKVGVKSPKRLVFNSNGYERVTKIYVRQGQFSENRCRVQMDNLWGYMDEEGNEVIPCQFVEARDFSEGLAAVKKEGRWSFIDKAGNSPFVLKMPEGDISAVGDFSGGLAWVKVGYHYGYINQKGEVVIPFEFTKVFNFKFGVARAVFKGKTGLIDTKGNWRLKPQRFEYVADFNRWGVAEAREKFNGLRCLVNAQGRVLTELKYRTVGTFHEGFAKIGDGKFFGLIDTRGQEVLPVKYQAIGEVSEGLLNVRPPHNTAWHFVDTLGHRAFAGDFEKIEPFQFGHSFVQVNHFDPTSRFVINQKGERLVLNKYDQFEFYESGIFGLYTPNGQREGLRRLHYYFADTEGQPMFGRLFEKIKPYKGDVALVMKEGRWGMINKKGLLLLSPKYPIVNMHENGEAIVNLPIATGLVDRQGNEIFRPAFDRIELVSGNRYRLEMGEKVGYAKRNGEVVWELQK